MNTKLVVAKKILSDFDFYMSLTATLFRLLKEYMIFSLRFAFYFPSLFILCVFMYALYHPELITAINNADAVRQFATDLNHSKGDLLSFIYSWLNISFIAYIGFYRLIYVLKPIHFYFFGGYAIADKRGQGAVSVLKN